MHDHVLNFKADFDILGTSNTMELVTVTPVTENYIWGDQVWVKPFSESETHTVWSSTQLQTI